MKVLKITLKAFVDKYSINIFVCLLLSILVFSQSVLANVYSYVLSGDMLAYSTYTFVNCEELEEMLEVLIKDYPDNLPSNVNMQICSYDDSTLKIIYKSVLKNTDVVRLKKYVAHYIPTAELVLPEEYNDSSSLLFTIVQFALVTAVIMILIIPVLDYVISRREDEFNCYRICGSGNSFINLCIAIHIIFIALISIFIGMIGFVIYSKWNPIGDVRLIYKVVPLFFIITISIEMSISNLLKAKKRK